jgi:4-hydroxy-tetrahydrodipicolinate synthase
MIMERRRAPHGVLVPIVTPTNARSEVDVARFKRHILWLAKREVDGIVVGGTTGEGHKLRREEKGSLIDAAVEVRRGLLRQGFQIIIGTGSKSFEEAEEVAVHARVKGCDAVLALPPDSDSQQQIESFYSELSKRAPGIALVAYNIPQLSGVSLQPRTIARLVEGGFVTGVKDSSGDKMLLHEWKQENPNTFVAVGSDSLIYRGVHEANAEAVVSGVGNIAPRQLIEAFRGSEQIAALAQQDINRINSKLLATGNYVQALKANLFKEPVKDDQSKPFNPQFRVEPDQASRLRI